MAQDIKGPGILWVASNISKSAGNPLDEDTFLRWYDEDHINEIVQTSGVANAFRCIHLDKEDAHGTTECPRPFLAFYPLPDLAFTQGPEFKKIKVKSDILPGTGIVYDMADIDVSYMGYVGQLSAGASKKSSAQYYVVSAIEPAKDATDDEVNQFFDEQAATVCKEDNYLRTLRFRLLYARTNAQSRALKGLPTTDEPTPEPPTWLAMHEFSAEPASDVRAAIRKDQHEVLKQAKQNETHAYRLARTHGKGKFFEDELSGAP